jgi:diguanylate cyclase (GGDEF)-like protein
MTSTTAAPAGPASGTPDKRAPDVARANIFNRLYIVAMFAVIIAIGSFGIDVIARSQETDAHVARTFQHANDVSEMRTALDREDFELLSEMRRRQGIESDRLVRATELFDAANLEVNRVGWAANEPLLKRLATRQATFVADSREIAGALANGDYARAARIDATSARPNVNAMRYALDAISSSLFRASVADAAGARRFMWDLQHLIGAVTLLGIALMAGFAVLLGRYKREADTSAAATLAALERAALTDSLTGLGNNRAFYEDFEREIARAKRHNHPMALALIDVDDFKSVNDKDGHSHGDAVLARVGERLRTTRQEDRGYRIGGDEFALILVETDPEASSFVLGRLQDQIRESSMGATVSIGYVNLSGDQLDAEAYELADTALYEAKRLGRNQTVSFENISGTVNVFSPRKADAVRTMIAKGLVNTAFQPIWDMQSTRPLGFEALARPHPELGLSGPQEAFDVAQRMRQLPELDMVCTRKTLETAVNLPPGSIIFLNYSPASLIHTSFDPPAFVAAVREAGLLPEQIVIELTERRIDDPATVAQRVAALRSLGVRMALDDTGSGHAGLEILSKVRFDFVKIDRGLIVEAMRNQEARGVLAGIIAIARETGSYLIAEGIETDEMLDFVRNAHVPNFAGVRGLQGYLLGKPELGRVDLRSLEQHRDFLASRQHDEPRSVTAIGIGAGELPATVLAVRNGRRPPEPYADPNLRAAR